MLVQKVEGIDYMQQRWHVFYRDMPAGRAYVPGSGLRVGTADSKGDAERQADAFVAEYGFDRTSVHVVDFAPDHAATA